jgi:hypothetical protein
MCCGTARKDTFHRPSLSSSRSALPVDRGGVVELRRDGLDETGQDEDRQGNPATPEEDVAKLGGVQPKLLQDEELRAYGTGASAHASDNAESNAC